VVGTYLNEERANAERTRLAEATGLSGRVVTSESGDFQVVLGSFANRAAADRKGEELISKGQVSEALVVPLPR
jgi:cell division protein FtsN